MVPGCDGMQRMEEKGMVADNHVCPAAPCLFNRTAGDVQCDENPSDPGEGISHLQPDVVPFHCGVGRSPFFDNLLYVPDRHPVLPLKNK